MRCILQKIKMEIEVQKFVSTKEISKERLEVREARERVLKDAERKAEARFVNFSQFWGNILTVTYIPTQVC